MIQAQGPVLEVDQLTVTHPSTRGSRVQAVSSLSFQVSRGETLGLVGESGCGKSSAARAIMLLPRPDSGRIFLMGTELTALRPGQLKRLRPRFQMIFQDSVAALNPRRCLGSTVAAPLAARHEGTRRDRRSRALDMLERVGFPAQAFQRRPHELSGGQCQRVQIARALITRPDLLICDEPVSSLDVSIQAQILNLLEEMRQTLGLSLVFISHDLAVVKNVSDRIAVMYLGRLCELASSEDLYERPSHPYTRALLEAVPSTDQGPRAAGSNLIRGEPPSPAAPPSGCRFRSRCPLAEQKCAREAPPLRKRGPGHWVACHHPLW